LAAHEPGPWVNGLGPKKKAQPMSPAHLMGQWAGLGPKKKPSPWAGFSLSSPTQPMGWAGPGLGWVLGGFVAA